MKNHKTRLLFLFLSLLTLVIIGLVIVQSAHRTRHAPKDAYSNAQDEIAAFEHNTKAQWASPTIDTSDQYAVRQFILSQPIQPVETQGVELKKDQIDNLYEVIVGLIEAYNDGSFKAVLQLHSRAPFTVNSKSLDNASDVQHDLRFEEINLPGEPVERLKAYWTLFQRYKYHIDFWRRYVAGRKKEGLPLPKNNNELFALQQRLLPNYIEDLKTHQSEYDKLRLTGISTNGFRISVYSVADIKSMPNPVKINSLIYVGPQKLVHSLFAYEDTPERVVRNEGRCLMALVSMVIQTNARDAFVPVTVSFYWSPQFRVWLPLSMSQHAYGGFRFLF